MQADRPVAASLVAGKEIYVFDWDGTLFDSMEGKTASFAGVIGSHLRARFNARTEETAIAKRYRELSGRPRAAIIRQIGHEHGVQIGDDDIAAISGQLFAANRINLANADMFADGVRLLHELLRQSISVAISSSTPQIELDYFVDRALPADIRRRIVGQFGSGPGFSKGEEHFRKISQTCGRTAETMLMIGDDVADDRLSAAAGVACVVVDRTGATAAFVRASVSSLDEIMEWLN